MSGCRADFDLLEERLVYHFIPKLFACEVSAEERSLFELPVKLAGLALQNPATSSDCTTSQKAVSHLCNAILGRGEMDVSSHSSCVSSARREAKSTRQKEHLTQFESLVQGFPERKQRVLRGAAEHSTGTWLSVLPCAKNDSVLSPREFRDGLAMRYQKPLLQMPSSCDGCGAKFSLEHGLNCANGVNLIERHNEVRDTTGYLAALAFSHVTREPVVREHGTGNGGALVCDLAVRGVWNTQTEALFDFRVVNTDAQSYASRPVAAVLETVAKAKKAKHHQACIERRADFTPFVVSTDGVLHREAEHFLKRLAARLSAKWQKPYSQTMYFVSVCLFVAILWATVHCLRGARRKMHGLFLEDGATMSLLSS